MAPITGNLAIICLFLHHFLVTFDCHYIVRPNCLSGDTMWKAVWGYCLIASGTMLAAWVRPKPSQAEPMLEFEGDWTPLDLNRKRPQDEDAA